MGKYKLHISDTPAGLIAALCKENFHTMMIRGFRYYRHHLIDWELIRSGRPNIGIGELFDMDEDELFQKSCVVDYDVYEALKCLKYLREAFPSLEDKKYHVREIIELDDL